MPGGAPAPDGGGAAPILRTEGLTVRFGGLAALNNVSIAVRRGEIRAIIGPNGAGKIDVLQLPHRRAPADRRAGSSSTARTSRGCPPTRSRASRWPARTRSPISCPAPPCSRTCASPPSRAGTPGACCATVDAYTDVLDRARAVLTAVGLADKQEELAANLSHGEQRNLEIGIALATEPKLLCLDEPTAGMSVTETHATVELVRRIAADLTILIVEHDMEVVMGLARTITVLNYGEVLAEGTPAEIQANPRVQEVYLKT